MTKRIDNGAETTLVLEGTLDAVTAPDMRSIVDEVVTANRKEVIVDMTSLRLIDSSGVGVIVSLFKRVRAYGGQVRIVGIRDQPKAIFRLLRLDKVFQI